MINPCIKELFSGYPSELIYFPTNTFGVDANRTFEYAGLVVFSDFELTRRHTTCEASQGRIINNLCPYAPT